MVLIKCTMHESASSEHFCVWFTQWETLERDVHQYEMTEECGVHLVGHQRSVGLLGRTFMGAGVD